MTDEKRPDSCPACHKGVLARVEARADGEELHFSCGHKHIAIGLGEKFSFHESIGFKAMRGGKGKPFVEGKGGDDLHKKSGKWMRREMTIDRENDSYKETVTDPETGQVVHSCEEPLSRHVGHGSAKKKPKK